MTRVFKILTRQQLAEAQSAGSFNGSPDDLRDGFIHLSTAEQVAGTLQKHFAGRNDMLLAEIDIAPLFDSIKWELSRNNQLFPHLYAPLPLTAISDVREVSVSDLQ